MRTEFWDNHYASFLTMQPSPFAEFCVANFLRQDDVLVEIGCGNGRDAQYIAPYVGEYYGIDACPKAAELCRKAVMDCADAAHPEKVINADASRFDYAGVAVAGRRTVIYSRFSIHSMNYQEEARLLDGLEKISGAKLLLVEVRTVFDPHYNVGRRIGRHEFESDHYRRFIEPASFLSSFSRVGLPVYVSLAAGQAAYGNEDPIVLRAVFDSEKMEACKSFV